MDISKLLGKGVEEINQSLELLKYPNRLLRVSKAIQDLSYEDKMIVLGLTAALASKHYFSEKKKDKEENGSEKDSQD